MSKGAASGILLLASILLCTSCGIQNTEDKQRAEKMEVWHTQAISGRPISEIAQEVAPLVEELAVQGEAGLLPLLDVIASRDETPQAKVLALIALTPHIRNFPRLSIRVVEITAAEYETTSRACATDMLGLFDLPETNERLHQLLSDSESRVKVAALIVLMRREDPQALALIAETIQDDETSTEQKGDIALMMPASVVGQHLNLFVEVLLNPEMPLQIRRRAVNVLGDSGEESVVATLKQSADTDVDEVIRVMGSAAVAAINEGLQVQ